MQNTMIASREDDSGRDKLMSFTKPVERSQLENRNVLPHRCHLSCSYCWPLGQAGRPVDPVLYRAYDLTSCAFEEVQQRVARWLKNSSVTCKCILQRYQISPS